jgi:drug/metabolite transporter (DMT)-like permease
MLSRVSKAGTWLSGQPHLLLTIAMTSWALNAVFARYVAGEVPPIMLSFARWAVAFVILAPFAYRHVLTDWPVIRRHLWMMAVFAMTGIVGHNTFLFVGLQYTEAINGALISSAGPLIVAFWTLVLFGDRLTAFQSAGIAVSLTGVFAIVARGDLANLTALRLNIGDVWLVGASTIYGLYTATLRRRPQIHPLSFMGVVVFLATVFLLPLAVWEESTGYVMRSTTLTFLAIGFAAIVPSLLAYVCYNRAIEMLGANRAGPFFHLVPAIGTVLAIVLLGEEPRLYHAAGLGLIATGIVLSQRRRRAA